MHGFLPADLATALPELWLAVVGMALLMLGVFRRSQTARPIA